MAWLAVKFLGLPRGLWIGGLLILGIIGAAYMYNHQQQTNNTNNQNIGRQLQQNEDNQQTISKVETANEARSEITAPNSAGDQLRYNQCMQSSRTPDNCKRFLPQ